MDDQNAASSGSGKESFLEIVANNIGQIFVFLVVFLAIVIGWCYLRYRRQQSENSLARERAHQAEIEKQKKAQHDLANPIIKLEKQFDDQNQIEIQDIQVEEIQQIQFKPAPLQSMRQGQRWELYKIDKKQDSDNQIQVRMSQGSLDHQSSSSPKLIQVQKNDEEATSTNYKIGFGGSRQFTFEDSRLQLPYFLPPNHTVPIWQIAGSVIRQDLTRISLPVILNEPLNILQRCCEMQADAKLLENMMKTEEHESPIRLVTCAVNELAQIRRNSDRLKKPFNPILGETFELVLKDSRFIAEQVSHHPPISAYCLQGEDFEVQGKSQVLQSFNLGNGSGALNFQNLGLNHYNLKKFQEHIYVQKPNVTIVNLVFGTMYFDTVGDMQAINVTTGEKLFIRFDSKSWRSNISKISGYVQNRHGKKLLEISGSWQDEIFVTMLDTKETKSIWKSPEPIKDAQRQYHFSEFTILLNHLSDDLVENNDPITNRKLIAPTDSRFRGDQRLFELGMNQEAEQEKIRLEVKQRKARSDHKDAGTVHVPAFFQPIKYVNPLTNQTEERYVACEGEKSYWHRRDQQQWDNLPDIF